MRRHGRRTQEPWTKEQRKELQRQAKNLRQRKCYDERRSQEFFDEYVRLCRKYKRFVGGIYGSMTGLAIRKDDDKNRLKGHLDDLEYRDY